MMWTKPYGMKEGFLIGGGLVVAGLMLQLSAGPVVWDAFRWPVNGIVLAAFLLFIAIVFMLRKRVCGFQFLGTYKAAIPALVYVVLLTVVMGLMPQTVSGSWLNNMLSFWPFVLSYLWLMVLVGSVCMTRLRPSWRNVSFLLNHLGVVIAIVSATLGNADIRKLQMTAFTGETEWRALDEVGRVCEPGLAIELHQFTMEEYPDHTPKRFASDITVYTEDGKTVRGTVEVNKPLKVNGWKIYQYGYDSVRGAESAYSVFQLVRDPWIFWVYLGIFLMIAGALCLMFFMAPKPVKV